MNENITRLAKRRRDLRKSKANIITGIVMGLLVRKFRNYLMKKR